MQIGDRFTRNGKTYVVSQVFGTNYGFREVTPEDEVKEVKEEVKEEAVIEEPVIKTRGRRKKA